MATQDSTVDILAAATIQVFKDMEDIDRLEAIDRDHEPRNQA